jgi:hypothetical protein
VQEEFYVTQEWQLACRIASSRRLAKSELLQRFLLYICEQSLTGNPHQITEQKIGTLIFNRAPDYNPGEDNIVRSYARMLRKRLEEYFAAEGQDEPLRIVIPRGGYLPIFETFQRTAASDTYRPPLASAALTTISDTGARRQDTPAPQPAHPVADKRASVVSAAEALPVNRPEQPPSNSRRSFWTTLLFGALVGALIASAVWFHARGRTQQATPTLAHPLWAQMFQPDRDTLIVPADSGLGILQNLTGHLVSVEEYANGSYASDPHDLPGVSAANLNDLRQQHYTSIADLNITSMLTQLPEFATGRAQIRYARSITTEDLKSANVILIGSSHTNPWVSLFDKDLNFRLKYMPEVDQSFVENLNPLGNEQKQYRNQTAETNRTYGTIDYLPSLEGRGHVLIIQGLNMAATQAAADTLFDSPAIQRVLQQAALPSGGLRHFELLVETSSIGATDPSSQIIATRFF